MRVQASGINVNKQVTHPWLVNPEGAQLCPVRKDIAWHYWWCHLRTSENVLANPNKSKMATKGSNNSSPAFSQGQFLSARTQGSTHFQSIRTTQSVSLPATVHRVTSVSTMSTGGLASQDPLGFDHSSQFSTLRAFYPLWIRGKRPSRHLT